MAYGIVQVIAASTHQEILVGSGNTQYQSIRILNPNDGVCYVAKNRDCPDTGYGSWEWKIPSQSYAIVPGPFQTVGIFYLDQSGAGHQGEIILYPSFQVVDEPFFVSIGRAILAALTSLDITEGPQPAIPAPGVMRLWVDVLGALGVETNPNGPTALDFRDNIRVTGTEQIPPVAGAGIELNFIAGTSQGILKSFDHNAAAYRALFLQGNPVSINPNGEGIVLANFDHREAQSNTGKSAASGSWTIFNFQLDLPAPSSGTALWWVWWTATFLDPTGNVLPYQVDCNLWTTQNPPVTVVAEVGNRQFFQVNRSGGNYSCTSMGLLSVTAATTYVLAAFPAGGTITESPGVGGAFSRIQALRLM